MKYRICLIPPKSKKARRLGRIVVTVSDGDTVSLQTVDAIPDSNDYDFEVPDGVPWKYSNMGVKGKIFDIEVVYIKKDKEIKHRPVPQEIK
jgi:hypothetical protein